MTIVKSKFTIPRLDAASMLGISTRTLDRYIRSGRLTARKMGGNILLVEDEINSLKLTKFQNIHGVSPKQEEGERVHRHVDSTVEAPKAQKETIVDIETGMVEEKERVQALQSLSHGGDIRDKVFEELYEVSRKEYREVHNKLELANYRLGQLETQLQHSVPALEYHQKSKALEEQELQVTQTIQRQEENIEFLNTELMSERFNKNIYIGLLFGLVALQPILWLILQK